jgi:hypothetical protein
MPKSLLKFGARRQLLAASGPSGGSGPIFGLSSKSAHRAFLKFQTETPPEHFLALQTGASVYIHCVYLAEKLNYDCRILQVGQ